jgi:cytochrome c peroxidase
VALQPAFMHNGAFTSLEDAIRYHLDAASHANAYQPNLLPADLRGLLGPMAPVLARLDPRLQVPAGLTEPEVDALVEFVRNGLLDPSARPQYLRRLIPERLPSGRAGFRFEFPDEGRPQ